MGELIIKLDDSEVKRYSLKDSPVVVGRSSESDLVLADSKISRRHAKFKKQGESWSVEDMGSRNGVYVNNDLILDDVLLSHDDVIKLGNFVVIYYEEGHLEKEVENIGKIRSEGGVVDGIRESALITDIDKRLHSLSVILEDTVPKLNVASIPGCAETVYKLKTEFTAFRAKFTEFYDSYLTLLSLRQFAMLLYPMFDEESILESTAKAVLKFVNAERTFIMLHQHDKGMLDFVAFDDKTVDTPSEKNFTPCRTTAEYVFESGEPVIISPGLGRKTSASSFAGMKSMVCVPVKHKKEIMGVLYADRKSIDTAFTPEEEHIMNVIGSWLGSALIGTKLLKSTGESVKLRAESLPYLSAEYVDQGQKNKKKLFWEGERHFGACLAVHFSMDNVQSAKAETVLHDLTVWSEEFRKKVFRFQGVVLSFTGNCMVGGFGFMSSGNAAELAVQCGKALRDAFLKLAQTPGSTPGSIPPFKIGICSGNGMWGTMIYPDFKQHVLLGTLVDQARSVARLGQENQLCVTEAMTVLVKGSTTFKPSAGRLPWDGQEIKLFLVE